MMAPRMIAPRMLDPRTLDPRMLEISMIKWKIHRRNAVDVAPSRPKDKQTDGQTDRQTHRQTDRHTLLFSSKNHVYKNVEAQIAKKIRTS